MPEKVNVSPTLIIGLGGTGSFALQYVKQKIRNRLESYESKSATLPAQIPFIEYLVLDTILPEDQLEEFVPDEFMDIGRVNISRVLDTLRSGSDEKILKWFPRHLDPGQIDSGAGGVRAIGRLCFFLNQWRIEERLRNKVKQITNSANIQNFLTEHLGALQFTEASTIDVHFVSSLCGGTGSACLLDIAYLVQHIIAEDTKQMPNCLAHLVTTEPFEGEPGVGRSSREYIQNNFAVSLSEIEHFTQKGPWEVEYRNGTRVHSESKPFSLAYLLGYKEGVSLSKKQICEIIGETIAIKSVHPDGKRIKGNIENHKPHVINTEDAQRKRRTYSSYNTQILKTDVDEDMFGAGVAVAQKIILSSLCAAASPKDMEQAFEDFEQNVFAAETGVTRLDFETLIAHVKSQLNIGEEHFNNASLTSRNVYKLSERKRRKISRAASLQVNQACEGEEQVIKSRQQALLRTMDKSFDSLARKTDEKINELLSQYNLCCASGLLADVSRRLVHMQSELQEYQIPGSGRDFDDDIAKLIAAGRSGIAFICAQRAMLNNLRPIVEKLVGHINRIIRTIDLRKKWCDEARQFLLSIDELLPKQEKLGRPSHTTSSVWTLAALTEATIKARESAVRTFVTLLEQEHNRGDVNLKICFLPNLSNSRGDRETTRNLLREAARKTVAEEIEQYQLQMQQKAADSMHEFVELASPAWQTEKTGEDIASVSITNCPENSKAGQIMARFGKNISFSQNGVNPREIVLFRSEHGASVNQLSNFKRCLAAVTRKMHMEGKERISDLCLDPAWNIAAPLPLEIEKLRLDFTLAIYFKLIDPGFDSYTFKNAAGATVALRQTQDKNKATRRFEAFGRLLEMDCDNGEDCNCLRQAVAKQCSLNTQNQNMESFKRQLSAHQEKLHQLLSDAKDVREHMQVYKEIESLKEYLEQIDVSIEAMRT